MNKVINYLFHKQHLKFENGKTCINTFQETFLVTSDNFLFLQQQKPKKCGNLIGLTVNFKRIT